jgi:hypothetical protein
MMGCRMVVGEVLGLVLSGGSRFPDVELFLANTISNPLDEVHVDGFRVFHVNRVIDNAAAVLWSVLKGRGWLGIVHFFQGSPDWACLFAIVEEEGEGTKFGFSLTGHN